MPSEYCSLIESTPVSLRLGHAAERVVASAGPSLSQNRRMCGHCRSTSGSRTSPLTQRSSSNTPILARVCPAVTAPVTESRAAASLFIDGVSVPCDTWPRISSRTLAAQAGPAA